MEGNSKLLQIISSVTDIGESLPGQAGEFFSWYNPYLKTVIIYIVSITIVLKFTPIGKWINQINKDVNYKTKESHVIKLIPIHCRVKVYWGFIWVILINIIAYGFTAMYFAGNAVQALLITKSAFNNIKAFLILITLTVFMVWSMWLQFKTADKIAWLIKTHNSSKRARP